MTTVANRISSAWSTVKCPGCGKNVIPSTGPVPGAPQPGAGEGAKRWSFIWLQPSGAICPECFFPLARYAKRQKWVQLFIMGVVLTTLTILLFILGLLSGFEQWLRVILRLTGVAAVLALVIGLVGIIVGGRRPAEQAQSGESVPPKP